MTLVELPSIQHFHVLFGRARPRSMSHLAGLRHC